MKLIISAFLLLIISFPVQARVLLQVKSAVMVQDSKVKISDIIDNYAEFNISDKDAGLIVYRIPAEKQNQIFKTKDIAHMLKSSDFQHICNQANDCNWKIPRQVSIENIGTELSKRTVIHRLKEKWKRICSDCKFYFKNIEIPFFKNTEKNWNLISNSKLPRGSFSFQVKAESEEKVKWGTGYVRIHKTLPVLRRNIQKGEVVEESYISWKDMDITYQRKSVPDAHQIKRKIAKRNLFKDQVLLMSQLARPNLVRSGSLVKVILESDSFQVSFVGQALQSGAEGDEIRVKNKASRKVLSGIIGPDSHVRVR